MDAGTAAGPRQVIKVRVNSSEEWRFTCEARHVLAMRRLNRDSALAYLVNVAKRRGQPASDALRDAASALWSETKGK